MSQVYNFISRLDEIEEFAEIASKDNFYGRRDGQTDQAKRKRDQIVGKASEWIVYEALIGRYPDLTEPDMKHYPPGKKSWKHDLSCSSFYMSVKGQDVLQSKRYRPSWVFQRNDKGLNPLDKPIYIAGVQIDLATCTGTIQAILSVDSLVFGELAVEYLRKTKIAVYLDEQGENLWQLP